MKRNIQLLYIRDKRRRKKGGQLRYFFNELITEEEVAPKYSIPVSY